MTTPPFDHRHVTGAYRAPDGAPVAGQLRFVPSTTVYDSIGHVVVAPTPILVDLDTSGAFDVLLLTTDAVGTSPTGWTWRVAELFAGGREWDLQLPAASVDPVSLASLAPAAPSSGLMQFALLSDVEALHARVEAVEHLSAVTEAAALVHPFLLMGV